MCWVVHIGSDRPVPAAESSRHGSGLQFDRLFDYAEPIDVQTALDTLSPHMSLPYVYLAHVGASCGYSCGLDHPVMRTQLRQVIRQQVSQGSAIEVVFSHVNYTHDELEFTLAMTPDELPETEIRSCVVEGRQYQSFHSSFPLEGHGLINYPRRIRFVANPAESTFASLDPKKIIPDLRLCGPLAPPEDAAVRDANANAGGAAARNEKWELVNAGLLIYVIVVTGVYLLIRSFL